MTNTTNTATEIEILTDTPNGPQVEYSADDDASDVDAVAAAAGWRVDWETPAYKLANGRYRSPLMLPIIAVLDIRGERRDSTPRHGRIVSLHDTIAEAEQAREQETDRQLGDARSVRDAVPSLMWAVGEVDAGAQVGDRVAFTPVRS